MRALAQRHNAESQHQTELRRQYLQQHRINVTLRRLKNHAPGETVDVQRRQEERRQQRENNDITTSRSPHKRQQLLQQFQRQMMTTQHDAPHSARTH